MSTERYTDEQGRKAIVELDNLRTNGDGMSELEATLVWQLSNDEQRLKIERTHQHTKTWPTAEEQTAQCVAEIDKFRAAFIANKGRSVYLIGFVAPDQVLSAGAGRGDDLSKSLVHASQRFLEGQRGERDKVVDG